MRPLLIADDQPFMDDLADLFKAAELVGIKHLSPVAAVKAFDIRVSGSVSTLGGQVPGWM